MKVLVNRSHAMRVRRATQRYVLARHRPAQSATGLLAHALGVADIDGRRRAPRSDNFLGVYGAGDWNIPASRFSG